MPNLLCKKVPFEKNFTKTIAKNTKEFPKSARSAPKRFFFLKKRSHRDGGTTKASLKGKREKKNPPSSLKKRKNSF